ncbi:MAG: hypothetical protein WBL72_16980 [Thermoguttaceae bacterium]
MHPFLRRIAGNPNIENDAADNWIPSKKEEHRLADCPKKRTKPWKAKACGKWRQSLAKRGQAAKCPL